MKLGVLAKTFVRLDLEDNLDAVRDAGFQCLQYNLSCMGLPALSDSIDVEMCRRVRLALETRGLSMAAISGTFNIIDPDIERRQLNFRRLRILTESCHRLGTSIVTICSGTRDPEDMWHHHPDNDKPEAWDDMVRSMRDVARIGEQSGVTMAFEPEVNNVVDTALKGRRLLDAIASPQLKVVFDAANLFHQGELPRMREILEEAVELLGPDIVLAHAKDLTRDGGAGDAAAGTGLLDYGFYLSRLHAIGFRGPLIAHGLSEAQVPACVAFLRQKLNDLEL